MREATRDSKESTPSLVCTQCTCRRCCVRHSARVPGLQSGSSESEDEGESRGDATNLVNTFKLNTYIIVNNHISIVLTSDKCTSP